MRAKEQSIIPDLKMAAQRAQSAGYPLEHVLNPEEQKLLQGTLTPSYGGHAGASGAGGTGAVKTLASGLRVQQGSDGKWYKVTQ
jgi:hypothetical protein